ncbi:hypothetical protein V1227_32515 [Lentzea sp. DG1S-22]|uniref:hypothetical protein n=1 Tax=Lentzea sp. DG1S-22 TaxID=3108822 RepID=UPI002E7894C3|nr:hypothetical protein [Lentzea sp. DG1S-22]WVH79706.1 hypothetical protein V1227_32515 [Lentzea sp. DG1S-22]
MTGTVQTVKPDTVSAVTDTLVPSINIPPDELDAVNQTILFMQEAARGLLPADVPTGESLYHSKVWYDTLTKALNESVGWVDVASSSKFSTYEETHSGTLKLGDLVTEALQAIAGNASSSIWSGLNKLISGNSEDPAITDFMNFWWGHTQTSKSYSDFGQSPTFHDANGQPCWGYAFFSVSNYIDDWRTMFVSSTYQEFKLKASGIMLKINMTEWNRVKSDVVDQLGQDIIKGIRTASLKHLK